MNTPAAEQCKAVFWDGSFNGAEFLLSPMEREVIRLFNAERQRLNLTPLLCDGGANALQMIATWLAKDMAVKSYVSHTDSLGRTPGQRWKLGYNVNAWCGEDIAFGYTTPAAVVAGWFNSPGHYAAIITPQYKYVGLALSLRKSDQAQFWVAEFGSLPLRIE